jgi:hypothetical protein
MNHDTTESLVSPGYDLAELLADAYDDPHAEWLRNKREDIAITLCGLLHEAAISRADLARKLDWKPSRVTRALSGNENLTINTIATILAAAGKDFDVVVRNRRAVRALQPWEKTSCVVDVLLLHGTLTQQVAKASAMIETVEKINRACWSRGATIMPTSTSCSPKVIAPTSPVDPSTNQWHKLACGGVNV